MSALDTELLDRLRALKPELRERFGVSAMAVFGSRVRGDHRADNDLDIVVDFETVPSLFRLADMDALLVERLGLRVDTVPRDCLHPALKDDIERELVAV
ncbi:nucleotidyltransferase family protein [Hyphomonadaceae bacterium ML37]|nr:nucleotidyltransferase family protein [Hyphomonadaceae bacterium ML37]